MDNETKTNVGEETTETTAVETPSAEADGTMETEAQAKEGDNAKEEKAITQEQLNKIVCERLKKQTEATYKKYGVKDDKELDELFKKAKSYDELKATYDTQATELQGYKDRNILSQNKIIPEKVDDVLTYFKGKGLELTDENLKKALESHEEWLPKAPNTTTIQAIGTEKQGSKHESGRDQAQRLFGMDFISTR